jgi:hypothetical protein
VWRGAACPRALAAAASRAAAQLARYEGAPLPAAAAASASAAAPVVAQGREPPALLAALGAAASSSPAEGGGGGVAVEEVGAYTADYQLYALAAAARGHEEE